jgi:predicted nucleotidyltransferase
MVRYIHICIADDLATLRTAASTVFSKPNFHHIEWAGVFGPFSKGTQTDESDVHVIVIEMPRKFYCPQLSLEDELYKVWGRKADITYIRDGELRGYFTIRALLCSRTLTGSDQDHEVVRLRNEAREILDWGFAKFPTIVSMIRKTQSLVERTTSEACNSSAAFPSYVCSSNHTNNHQPGISNIAKAPAFRSR